jgi:hypothetical protein
VKKNNLEEFLLRSVIDIHRNRVFSQRKFFHFGAGNMTSPHFFLAHPCPELWLVIPYVKHKRKGNRTLSACLMLESPFLDQVPCYHHE